MALTPTAGTPPLPLPPHSTRRMIVYSEAAGINSVCKCSQTYTFAIFTGQRTSRQPREILPQEPCPLVKLMTHSGTWTLNQAPTGAPSLPPCPILFTAGTLGLPSAEWLSSQNKWIIHELGGTVWELQLQPGLDWRLQFKTLQNNKKTPMYCPACPTIVDWSPRNCYSIALKAFLTM